MMMVLFILVEITIPLEINCVGVLEDLSSDGNVSDEGALLVDVGSLDGLLGGLESDSDISVVSGGLLLSVGQKVLGVKEHSGLLLESFLGLLGVRT